MGIHQQKNITDRITKLETALEQKNRELEIEAALERVRAAAMGMRKPEDLARVGEIVFKELKGLGFTDLRNTEIIIIEDLKETLTSYYYSDYGVTGVVEVLYKTNPTVKKWVKDLKKANNAFAEVVIHKKEIAAWRKYREEVGHKPDPKLNKVKEVYYYSYSIGSGGLSISTFKPASTEQIKILERFRNVFNLSYQRYIEIAQAEAQAREAKIELGLERVRARAMAMQNSDELAELVSVVFKELTKLDFALTSCVIWISDPQSLINTLWVTSAGMNKPAKPVQLKPFHHSFFHSIIHAWKEKDPKWIYTLKGKEKKSFERAFFTGRADMPIALKKALTIPKKVVFSASFNNFGALEILGTEPLTPEKFDILHRFGKVFNASYTRFNDLKKAEEQAREAQIETSLEKVRAQALGMHKADELMNVCKVLFKELLTLGFTWLRNAIIHNFKDEKRYFTDYDYSDLTGGAVTDISYDANPIIKKFINQIRRSDNAFVEITIKEKELKDWRKFRKKGGQPDDPLLNKASAIHYYLYSIHNASIGISTFEAINEEQLQLLKRFRNVFDFAYRRYLDIAQAETQAREAQIEAALERVRSRTMAMHKTSELQEVIHTVHKELLNLNLSIDGGSFVVINDDVGSELRCWGSGGTAKTSQEVLVPHFNMPFCTNLIKGIKGRPGFFTEEFSQKEKKEYFTKLFKHKPWSDLSSTQKKSTLSSLGGYTRSVAVSKHTSIFIINHLGRKFTEAENDILNRFAKVFEQTYTRFLDLKKAEAQAREAQIEAALERVRARTMGMHNSNDLLEVTKTMGEQFVQLGFNKDESVSFITDSNEQGYNIWLAAPGDSFLKKFYVPRIKDKTTREWKKAGERGDSFYTFVLTKEEKDIFFRNFFENTELRNYPTEGKDITYSTPGMASTVVLLDKITLTKSNFTGIPYTEEQNAIIKRFAFVFQQSYTRFLDLQKAEAQARESQIEVGLERVRSRAMAMQTSEELNELIGTVFTELTKLDLVLTRCVIWVFDPATNEPRWWMANSEEPSNPMNFLINYHEHPAYLTFLQEWKKQNIRFVYDLKGEDKISWDDILFSETELVNLPDVVKNGMKAPDRVLLSASFNNFGALNVASLEPLSDEHFDILLRFAKVFDLTYTRFNDLKQAEEQARESRIQLALERVRARTMAMQKSNELMETAVVLFNQLSQLGENIERTIIGVMNEEERVVDVWATRPDGSQMTSMQKFPIDEPIVMQKVYAAWRQQKKSIVIDLKGEELESYSQFLKGRSSRLKRESLGERRIENFTFFSKGILGVINADPNTPANIELYERFAAVFDQTYTRFLDLQKSEAQARESQIQLALERVRARTMAMQKSDELKNAATLLFQQVKALGVPAYSCGYNIWEKDEKVFTSWMSTQDGTDINAIHNIPLTEDANFIRFAESRQKSEQFFVLELRDERMQEHYEYLKTIPAFKAYFAYAVSVGFDLPKTQIHHIANFSQGNLLFITLEPCPEFHDVFKRFAEVFDQTYTRFLDLQKAEAQARESQIQLALERVRARTMAMQKSEELPETSHILFEQMKELGEPVEQLTIGVVQEENKVIEISATLHGDILKKIYQHSLDEPFMMSKIYHAWKTHQKTLIVELKGDELNAYNKYRNELTKSEMFPTNLGDEHRRIVYAAFFSKGMLALGANEPRPPESLQLLERFAGVFDQAYIRFIDLKNAEAQSRESQIQLALERVRARTMAMQKSDELPETSFLFFQQVKELGETTVQNSIGIVNEEAGFVELSTTVQGHHLPHTLNVPIDDPYVMAKAVAAWKAKRKSLKLEFEGEELKNYNEHRNSFFETKINFPEDRWIVNIIFFSQGWLSFSSDKNISGETFELLKRFAAVFEQTYTRFLDLQKAEEQAREAQIETALERVRAVAMAMRKPEELMQISETIYDQLQLLGFEHLRNVQIAIDDDEKKTYNGVEYSEYYQNRFKQVPYDSSPLFAEIAKEIKRSHTAFYQKEISGQEFEDWRNWRTNIRDREDSNIHPGLASATSMCFYLHSVGTGMLGISTFKSITIEQLDILKRFKNVFELSYRRYIDIEKAEVQVREAQIELALERVRARTMAMHRSEELAETAQVMFHQLQELGGVPDRIAIGIVDEAAGLVNYWSTDQSGSHIDKKFKGRLSERTVLSKTYEAWKGQKRSLVIDLHGNDLKEWLKFAREEMKIHVDETQIKDRRVHSLGFFSHGWILVTTHEPQLAETIQILERFASVFNLTYRRFLDLEKAEAQAREAQIEAALERVRAKAMAMHKSEDLNPAVATVFQELDKLDLGMLRCGIGILYKDKRTGDVWTTAKSDQGNTIQTSGDESMDIHPLLQGAFDAWQRQGDFSYVLEGEDLVNYYQALTKTNFQLPESASFDTIKENQKQFYYVTSFESGTVFAFREKEFPEEARIVMKRFAGVFNLTYKRFLDLQKAEAQAKEAQIEAALEKVRSRSLAMHKSDELQEVVNTVFERLTDLNIEMDSCNIAIFKEGTRDFEFWIASPFQKKTASFSIAGDWNFPIIQHLLAARESGQDFFSESFSFEEKNRWFEFAFKNTDFSRLPDERLKYILEAKAYALSIAFAKNTGVQINSYSGKLPSEEEIEILKRFSKVFEQAYIRFLDLEKAEAQARESQIQLALERVRARTMAMQHSNELQDAAILLFEQIKTLGIPTGSCAFNIWNNNEASATVWSSSVEGKLQDPFLLPHTESPIYKDVYTSAKNADIILIKEVGGMGLKKHFDYLTTVPGIEHVINKLRESGYVFPEKIVYHFAFFNQGYLSFHLHEFYPEAKEIFVRFAKVFEQTYTRFLDLQKAEAQSREAHIEAALERVRSKTMAMHNSNDVGDTVATMFAEFVTLGIETIRCGIAIIHDIDQMEVWTAKQDEHGKVSLTIGSLPMTIHPMLISVYENWKNKKSQTSYELIGEDLKNYFREINNSPNYPIRYDIDTLPNSQMNTAFYFPEGCLFVFSQQIIPTESSNILKRFAGVFGQTYRRYLDLQKAEAQAREAQIEASLERVRAKAMAMHSSKDLGETLSAFYRELKSLSAIPIRCGVALMDKETVMAELTTMNTTDQGDSIEIVGRIKMTGHPVLDGVFKNWQIQKEYHAVLRGNQIKEYYQVLKPQISYLDYSHDEVQFGYYFMFKEGDVYAWTEKELTEDELNIYRRFTTVISLTYKRYKDLQQAEAQAREAKIEAGLERVRARTMAMHSSDDVGVATATMFTELEKLGIENLRGGITIIRPDQTQEVWSVTNMADGKTVRAIGVFDIKLHPLWRALLDGKERQKDYLYYWMAGQDKQDYINILNATPNYLAQPIKEFPDVHVQSYFFGEGAVWTNSLQAHSEEDKQVMKRFASVFSLTFRRYQDLKKAEAQAREATIEAALEKVRGKAMAMHNSNDLSATASMIFTELRKLGINPVRCGVSLQTKETRKNLLYYSIPSAAGDNLSMAGSALLEGHPVLSEVYDSWMRGEDYFPVLKGESLISYYQILKKVGFDVPASPAGHEQYGYYLAFSEGMFYGWAEKPYTESEIKILKRFASVIDLTFRRYMELQKSEANAREAVKQAALDRVRADIASMRTIGDLDRITPLIWNELTILGIPFIRCGVFIMDESQQLIHTFLSTPDGKAIAAFHLPYDTPGNIRYVVSNWKENKKYIDHWKEAEFIQFAEILVTQRAISSAEQYLKTIPHGGFYLHFLPFLQGMLYVGNTEKLNEEQIELIQHVADAFSTAYARYEDFNRLEAAKKTVENTLTDLKQAQQQLVQSEKMASLGELTAGIAHEIQNPLNFVNNFSDVSNELLEEMKNELEKGNKEDAMTIVEDVKQNLEKILHHGKRADAIVKGMLQHSRTSSGQKEPTDINILADEYLRLAYHGLRAKDKTFNAKFETQFDNNIGKINIIPQDIGRVILNLINNAFYAVTEKKKHALADSAPNGYEPVVTVTTKKENGKIEIKVKDNGNGIPQKVLDKIFQPFFTTKPTGQGTGLGLSLSYDIVTKGHGGELRVETSEGNGSEFTIQLSTT